MTDLYNQMISRQVEIFTEKQQDTLKNAKVCVLGCGGLGSTAIEQLIRSGFENLTVVDCDVYDKSNFNRQIRANLTTLNKSKSTVVKEESLKINPDLNITSHDTRITRNNISSLLKGKDIIIDAVDNVYTRVLMSRECQSQHIPMVHAAINETQGQLTILEPEGPNYEELFRLKSAYKELNSELISYLNRISSKKPQVLGTTASIFASLEVNECIKYLLDLDDVVIAPNVLLWDAFDLTSLRIIDF